MDDLKFKLRTAKENLAQAEYDLSQTRIVAPFAGRVVERMIQLGETVTAGKECFRIDDFDPLLARVYFPERELGAGARRPARRRSTLDAHPGPRVPGPRRAREPGRSIARTAPSRSRSRSPTASGTLRPGSFARVRLRRPARSTTPCCCRAARW